MTETRDDPQERALTPEELRLARELLESYRAARAVGKLFRLALVGLAVIAAGIAAWDAIAAKARTWLGH